MSKENRYYALMHYAIVIALAVGFTAGFAAQKAIADDASEQPSAEVTSSEEITELQVAPLEFPIYPEDRPMWVDQPNKIEPDYAELVVLSVPSLTSESSLKSLSEQQKVTLQAYIDEHFGHPGAGESMKLKSSEIDLLVDRQRTYEGKVTIEDGEMFQHASVIVLDDEYHKDITNRYEELEIGSRLKGVGLLGAGAFAVLAAMTGLLRTIAPRDR